MTVRLGLVVAFISGCATVPRVDDDGVRIEVAMAPERSLPRVAAHPPPSYVVDVPVSAIAADWKPTAPASAAVSSPATWKSRIPDVWIRNVRIGPVIVSPVRI